MKTQLQFGGQGRSYQIKSAILVYQDTGNAGNVAATVHDVDLEAGSQRPVIKPGQPITLLALEQLMQNLGRGAGGGFIPENIVSLSLDTMAWWCPAGRRRIWFKPSHTNDKSDYKALKALNGKFVHHPPLLFMVKNAGLNVFALLEDKRPTPKTKLFRAPYWNLSEGHMCSGDLKLPVCSPDKISGFESAFFDSQFTHTSAGAITHHRGGHLGLWTELARRRRRPDAAWWRKNLVRSTQTPAKLLK